MNNSKFELFKKDELHKKNSLIKKNYYYHEKLDNFFMVNHKKINLAFLECFNNIFFHALDTIKVRNQAKNIVEDVSLYLKNRVFEKRKKNFNIKFNL